MYDSNSEYEREHPTKHWIIESECPVIVEDNTVTFNTRVMQSRFAYKFEVNRKKLIAVKGDYGIDIYEVYGKEWWWIAFHKLKSVTDQFQGILCKMFPELKNLSDEDFKN